MGTVNVRDARDPCDRSLNFSNDKIHRQKLETNDEILRVDRQQNVDGHCRRFTFAI